MEAVIFGGTFLTSVQQCAALFSSSSHLTVQEQQHGKQIKSWQDSKPQDCNMSAAKSVRHLFKFVEIVWFLMKAEAHQFTLEAFYEGAATEKIPDDAVRERTTVQLQISCTQQIIREIWWMSRTSHTSHNRPKRRHHSRNLGLYMWSISALKHHGSSAVMGSAGCLARATRVKKQERKHPNANPTCGLDLVAEWGRCAGPPTQSETCPPAPGLLHSRPNLLVCYSRTKFRRLLAALLFPLLSLAVFTLPSFRGHRAQQIIQKNTINSLNYV